MRRKQCRVQFSKSVEMRHKVKAKLNKNKLHFGGCIFLFNRYTASNGRDSEMSNSGFSGDKFSSGWLPSKPVFTRQTGARGMIEEPNNVAQSWNRWFTFYFFLTHSWQCRDVTRRQILKNHKTRSRLWALQTAYTQHSGFFQSRWVKWVSEPSGLHRCHPGARPGTLVTPRLSPLFFFWKQTAIHPEPELRLQNYSGASQFTLMSVHAGFLAASFQDLLEPLGLWELCSGGQMATVSQDEPSGPPDSCPFMALLLLLLLQLPRSSMTWRLLTTGARSSAGCCCLFFPAQEFVL